MSPFGCVYTNLLTRAESTMFSIFLNIFLAENCIVQTGRESCGRLLLLFVWKEADTISVENLNQIGYFF